MATAIISNKPRVLTKNIEAEDFSIVSIKQGKRSVKINYDLPFRIRLTNIMVPGYGPNNVPPIGIAIVGVNNYIL